MVKARAAMSQRRPVFMRGLKRETKSTAGLMNTDRMAITRRKASVGTFGRNCRCRRARARTMDAEADCRGRCTETHSPYMNPYPSLT